MAHGLGMGLKSRASFPRKAEYNHDALALSLCSVNQNWPRESTRPERDPLCELLRAGHKEGPREVRAAISGRFRASGRVRRDRSSEKFGIRLHFIPLQRRYEYTCSVAQEQRTPQTGRCVLGVVSGRISSARTLTSMGRAASVHARGDLPSACSIVHSLVMVNISLSWPTGFAADHLVFDALIAEPLFDRTSAFPAHAHCHFHKHASFSLRLFCLTLIALINYTSLSWIINYDFTVLGWINFQS